MQRLLLLLLVLLPTVAVSASNQEPLEIVKDEQRFRDNELPENTRETLHEISRKESNEGGGGGGLLLLPGKHMEAKWEGLRGGGGNCSPWDYLLELALKPAVATCAAGKGGQDFTLAEDLLGYPANPDHKDWPKFGVTVEMGIATVLGFVGAALANAGGVGGGGLFVPLFNLLLGFDAKTSAALSKAMVLGGSLASYSFNIQLRNPTGPGPLIDYNIALLLMPFLVLGISVGVSFNVIFPGWLIIVLLTLFLGYTTYGVTKNGLKTYKKESDFHQRMANDVQRIEGASNGNGNGNSNGDGHGNGVSQPTPTDGGEAGRGGVATEYQRVPTSEPIRTSEPVPKLKGALGRPHSIGGDLNRPLLKGYHNGGGDVVGARFARSAESGYPSYVATHEIGVHLLDLDDIGGGVYMSPSESPRYSRSPASPTRRGHRRKPSFVEKMHMGELIDEPIWRMIKWEILVQMVCIWFLFFLIQIGKTNSELCGLRYWIITSLQIPVAILSTISGGYQMLQKQKAELDPNEGSSLASNSGSSGSVKWTVREISAYPLFALLAGTMGGLLGIGGGMVIGPVLLGLKIHPQVTSATTSFMVIFSAAMSVTEFYLLGRIPVDFAMYFSGLCMVAALIGVSIVRALVMRSGRASIIIFVLAFVIGISGVIIAVLGTAKVLAAFYAGAYMGFHSLCHD